MKNFKRMISTAMAIIMVIALFSGITLFEVSAETSGTTGDCTWSVIGSALTISGNGKMGNYDDSDNSAPWGRWMASVIIESGVTSIGDYAFYNSLMLDSVSIPSSVTSIGDYAFEYCNNLVIYTTEGSYAEQYAINNGIKYVSATSGTTGDCTWSLNGTVLTISGNGNMGDYDRWDNYAPWGNWVTSVVIKSGVTSIGDWAFSGCSGLTSITIPSSVTSIGAGAFILCSGLTSIDIPSSVTSIGDYAFHSCSGLETITVESGNKKYKSIDNCLIDIETDALILGCKNSKIPSSVKSIGDSAFAYCKGLTSINIPGNVKSVGDYAFYFCEDLTSVVISDGVTSIGDHAFDWCGGLASVEIPSSVTSIGYCAFSESYDLVILTTEGSYAEQYAIKEHIKYISATSGKTGDCTWSLDGTVLTISGNGNMGDYDRWDNYAPWSTVVTSVIIKSGVKSIGSSVFNNCRGLTSIVIPGSVTSIGDYAFYNCYGLMSIEIPNGVTSIGDYAFEDCIGLTSIVIPSSVTSIGDGAFYGCGGLTSIVIPSSVTSIGNYAFEDCIGLTSIVIPSSVTSIGYQAFYGCSGLTSIDIPSSVTSIGRSAFRGCSGLTSISIPSSVTSIGDSAFYGCYDLVIYTTEGSYAEQYAIENDIDYVIIGAPVVRGDPDGDGEITVTDALSALRVAAKLAEPTPELIATCDIDNDGVITVTDALAILRVAAKLTDTL